MGVQSPPCASAAHEHLRLPLKPSAESSKAENSSSSAPGSLRESTRSVRTPAKTANKPLVPGTPWPKGVPAPSGRKGKSVSPSPEKVISAPPAMNEVEVPAQPPRSPSSNNSSLCSASPHTESPHCDPVGEYTLESGKQPRSLLGYARAASPFRWSRFPHAEYGGIHSHSKSAQQDIKCNDFVGEVLGEMAHPIGHPEAVIVVSNFSSPSLKVGRLFSKRCSLPGIRLNISTTLWFEGHGRPLKDRSNSGALAEVFATLCEEWLALAWRCSSFLVPRTHQSVETQYRAFEASIAKPISRCNLIEALNRGAQKTI
ncbi:hypothetical protein V8E53_010322 [Lactarius tabidus]